MRAAGFQGLTVAGTLTPSVRGTHSLKIGARHPTPPRREIIGTRWSGPTTLAVSNNVSPGGTDHTAFIPVVVWYTYLEPSTYCRGA